MAHFHEVELTDGMLVRTGYEIEEEMEAEPIEAERLEGELRFAGGKRTGDQDQRQKELESAATALEAGQIDALPAPAKAVWERMFKTALRYCRDERKSAAVAWRAIRQKYHLQPKRQAVAGAKSFIAGTGERSGGGWMVRVTEERNAEMNYERVDQLPVPSYPGVAITVGVGRANKRNLISVIVPARLVSDQPGAVGAIKWVRRHFNDLYRTAKGDIGAQLTAAKRSSSPRRRVQVKRFRAKAEAGAIFVDDPRRATDMIGYGEVYVPFEVDLQGEYATGADVVKMAHEFLLTRGKQGEMHARWELPDGTAPAEVVESFIAREGDQDFIEGAWVMGVKYAPEIWEKVLAGDYTGFSIGGRWGREPAWRA